MHDRPWAGVNLKIEYGLFHLLAMWRSLEPPALTPMNAALEATGAIVDTGWQRSFYPHFDAFLTATRSVPEIINACFGVDTASREMNTWFQSLTSEEQVRRRAFTDQFGDARQKFGKHPLSVARNISVHRTGVAPVRCATTGFFGVKYVGDPVTPIPISELREIGDPEYAFLGRPVSIRPRYTDFYIGEEPLQPACQNYIDSASILVNEARAIVAKVHGSNSLTIPGMPP